MRELLGYLAWTRRYYQSQASERPAALDDDRVLSRSLTERYLRPYKNKGVLCRCVADLRALRSDGQPSR